MAYPFRNAKYNVDIFRKRFDTAHYSVHIDRYKVSDSQLPHVWLPFCILSMSHYLAYRSLFWLNDELLQFSVKVWKL